ncbi:MAG: tRNA uridine-5-carboxymethylaminomethyl(34) synthesis enzyme MnmG [Blautia obeum]|nr:tRNA uridine-5-carboxymethylaminomethyl(34) synthesis enzyme MnmG [Blautia obeum]
METKTLEKTCDIVVVGAGHAGCEASLACARLGLDTVMFTVSVDSIALMPCNPNVGGSSKGHLVKELDALGGEMGKNIDKTFIQSKMLNSSKGPAVHSLRAQADKQAYSTEMRKTLENQENLTIKQGEVTKLLVEEGKITGVQLYSGAVYHCQAVVLCTGTYLKARCIYGDVSNYTGPNGLQAANYLTDSLKELGIEMFRFKTGTPARIAGNTINYSKMEEQFGDERVVPFSFSTDPESVQIQQKSCWLTYTNEKTHEIIRNNLDRSPLYSGMIEGTGPRYCPSIEDKVVRFADKKRHQVFIEPEGLYTNEMYIGGMSSSLPEDVQDEMYHSVPGLEHAKIVKNAYAIEYDCINPRQLYPTLEFKKIKGLFSGGQFNGSSGYEEAAAQGLIAGINAAMEVKGREQLVLDRSEAYIGVLIDDLVTKENHEPYRMMTSRAEYRLLLRQDNADLRLRKKGYQVGLIDEETYQAVLRKEEAIQKEVERTEHATIGGTPEVQKLLEEKGSTLLKSGTTIAELIRRPELNYEDLAPIDKERSELPWDVKQQVEINLKYEGYIKRQLKQVEQFKKLEAKKIPEDLDYEKVGSLRIEARQKLEEYRPISIGQASRISGVSPADISVLLVYLEQYRRNSNS